MLHRKGKGIPQLVSDNTFWGNSNIKCSLDLGSSSASGSLINVWIN